MARRIGLIIARQMRGKSRGDVADASGINRQRYKRFELDTNVRVDIEEAYEIAKVLDFEHPIFFLPSYVEKLNEKKGA